MAVIRGDGTPATLVAGDNVEPLRAFVGTGVAKADIDAEFILGGTDKNLSTGAVVPSSGDIRLEQVSDGNGGRVYARMKPGEIPIAGGRRIANMLPDLALSGWTKATSGTDAVAAAVTEAYVTDPVYGVCTRLQLDAGVSADANYSWLYKLITASSSRRSKVMVSCWIKSRAGTVKIGFTRGIGVAVTKTITTTWQQISEIFEIPAGGTFGAGDYGIGWLVRGPAHVSGTGQPVDLLIATNDSYGPQVELLADPLSARPYASPAVNYGHGATGVRYLPPELPPLIGKTWYDDFDREDTTDAEGLGSSVIGPLTWQMRDTLIGETAPPQALGHIANKHYVTTPPETDEASDGNTADYATLEMRGTVRGAGANISYVPNTLYAVPGTYSMTWAIAIGPADPIIKKMVHFSGTDVSWNLQLWLDGNDDIVELGRGTFSPALSWNGSLYTINISVNDAGNAITMTVPGKVETYEDSRIAECLGPWVFWEHFMKGATKNLLSYKLVWATEDGQEIVPPGPAIELPVSYPALRPRPAATVPVTYSTDISNAAWTKAGTTAVVQTGETPRLHECQVFKLSEDTSTGLHGMSQATGLGAVQQIVTAIVKGSERSRVRLRINNGTDGDVATAIFDLSATAPVVVSGTGGIDNRLGDAVYILTITGTPTVTGSVAYLELVSTGTTVSYTGTSGSGALVYYMGAEAGAAFTAPIITAGSSVNRLADSPALGVQALGSTWRMWGELLVPSFASIVDNERIIGTDITGDVTPLRATTTGRLQAYNGTTTLQSAAGLLTAGKHTFEVNRSGTTGQIKLDGVSVASGTFDFNLGSTPRLALGAEPDGSGGGVIEILRFRVLDTSRTQPSALWRASSKKLPRGMTLTRSSPALYLAGGAFSTAVYLVAPNNAARFGIRADDTIGLRIEGARTNLLARWAELDDSGWAQTATTVTANSVVAPNGVAEADELFEAATTAEHRIGRAITTVAVNYTQSGFIKKVGRQFSFLRNTAVTGLAVAVNLDAGTVADALGTPIAKTITAFPNNWHRVSQTFLSSAASKTSFWQLSADGVYGNRSYLGDSTKSNAFWGMQLEAGDFPSSPIPTTTAASVLRAADITAQTVTVPAAGFAVAFSARTAPGLSGDQYLWSLDDGTANNVYAIRRNSSGAIVLDVISAGVTVASITGATVANLTDFKVSASFATDSIGLCVNSTVATRDSSAALPAAPTTQRYGHDYAGANHWFGDLVYAPDGINWLAPVNDAGLQALNA